MTKSGQGAKSSLNSWIASKIWLETPEALFSALRKSTNAGGSPLLAFDLARFAEAVVLVAMLNDRPRSFPVN
jgi:hypothetical protein